MNTLRLSRISLLVVFALAGIAQTAKRPLNHRDYDPWRAISGQVLSHDGKFLAYSLFPEEGDGEVVVKNLATGKEVRESAGIAAAGSGYSEFRGSGGGVRRRRARGPARVYRGQQAF